MDKTCVNCMKSPEPYPANVRTQLRLCERDGDSLIRAWVWSDGTCPDWQQKIDLADQIADRLCFIGCGIPDNWRYRLSSVIRKVIEENKT